ncbi:MAG: dTDP-4-dehydrorhamnose 3,5-epimerase [Clostridiaceae bacterium]|nr:dTDP-4-dehydrorhamnose 3,5-epimerase [Clostridiaceae bacterium]
MRSKFSISDTNFPEAKVVSPFYAEDERGHFQKGFEEEDFRRLGLETGISEVFESYSKQSVLRGLHFQTKNPQIKIVRVLQGGVLDVIVDVRKNSPTFGRWQSFQLSSENRLSLWIPRGFAHGFYVLSSFALVSYICIGKYEQGHDTGILWNDPDLAIEWGNITPIVSGRDAGLMRFSEYAQSSTLP